MVLADLWIIEGGELVLELMRMFAVRLIESLLWLGRVCKQAVDLVYIYICPVRRMDSSGNPLQLNALGQASVDCLPKPVLVR